MIVGRCTFDGCNVITIGSRCVKHDPPVRRAFVRGRPYIPATSVIASHPAVSARERIVTTSLVPFRRTADPFARP